MTRLIDTLLLLALPASGKSEVRKYLAHLSPRQCTDAFHLGPTVQLDDFPYVHLMRRIDEELAKLGQPSIFFLSPERPFIDSIEWGTLIELINEDFANLVRPHYETIPSAARHLFERFENARQKAGGGRKITDLPSQIQEGLVNALEEEATKLQRDLKPEVPSSLLGKTVVIEFARGGPQNADFPLSPPLGYQYSLAQLSDEILQSASILYIWVTPEESRRKNAARTDPNDPGSILHHGVPVEVMLNDYGLDDMEFLIRQSDRPDTIKVTTRGKTFYLPVARFDNRVDKTTFVRNDPSDWKPDQIESLHNGLMQALEKLASL